MLPERTLARSGGGHTRMCASCISRNHTQAGFPSTGQKLRRLLPRGYLPAGTDRSASLYAKAVCRRHDTAVRGQNYLRDTLEADFPTEQPRCFAYFPPRLSRATAAPCGALRTLLQAMPGGHGGTLAAPRSAFRSVIVRLL